MDEIGKYLPTVAEAGHGLLLAMFTVYQAYFHRMHGRIVRITDGLGPVATESYSPALSALQFRSSSSKSMPSTSRKNSA